MRCQKLLPLFLIFFLFLVIPLTYAEWSFPTNLSIPEGLKWKFQDYWVFSNGSSMTITKFFINNWMNYTVDANGTQDIGNVAKPSNVYVDGLLATEGDRWNYSNQIVTVSNANSEVSLTWFISPTRSFPLYLIVLWKTVPLAFILGWFAIIIISGLNLRNNASTKNIIGLGFIIVIGCYVIPLCVNIIQNYP